MAAPPPRKQVPVGGAGAAPKYTSRGASKAPAASGMNEEGVELTKEEWDAKVTADITTKPIFLIAIHGLYDEVTLAADPVPVPKGCLIIELTSIGDILNNKCAISNTPLHNLLKVPRFTAQLITSDPGISYNRNDVALLHRSAKYTDKDTYYQRMLYVSDAELANDKKNYFFIDKFYYDASEKKYKHERQTELLTLLISVMKLGRVYTNRLINYIVQSDEDAKRAGGCVCIFATCGNKLDDINISDKQYDKIQEHFNKHQYLPHLPPHNFFNAESDSDNSPAPAAAGAPAPAPAPAGAPAAAGAPAPASPLPEEFAPELNFRLVTNQYIPQIGKYLYNTRTGLLDKQTSSSSNTGSKYKASNTNHKEFTIETIPANIEHTKLMVNNRTYYIGRKFRTDLTRNEALHELKKFKRMKVLHKKPFKKLFTRRKGSHQKKTRRRPPKKVEIFYNRRWVPVKI